MNDQIDAMRELLGKSEPLVPPLEACLVDTSSGPWIKNPLVNTMYTPAMNALYNAQYRSKLTHLAELAEKGAWDLWIWLHERPWRFDALCEIADEMTDEEFWQEVAQVWIDSENIRENAEAWDELLRTDRPGHEHMMGRAERVALLGLPEIIDVYQGHTDQRDDGWSWTTDRDKAEWFAHRFAAFEDSEPALSIGSVLRQDVLAYFTGRNESEILIAPELVDLIQTIDLPPKEQT